MAKVMGRKEIYSFVKDLQELFPDKKKLWKDYDEEADVLYLSFRKPQDADDSVMENDVIYHYDDEELVGVTVLNVRENIGSS